MDPSGVKRTAQLTERGKRAVEAALECAEGEYGINIKKVPIVTDVDASQKFASWTAGYLPCITATRCKSGGFHVSSCGRKTALTELMRCQGMNPAGQLKDWSRYMTAAQLGHAVGNAMSVTVLERIFQRALFSAGFLDKELKDKHMSETYKPAFLE